MDLDVFYSTLLFHINKAQGQFYPYSELDLVTDVAQMEIYNEFFEKFLTSQRIDDALAPFYRTFTFTPATNPGGLITAPADYYHCQTLILVVQDASGNTRQRPATKLNADELAGRLNSQIFPPTSMNPVYITSKDWNVQLYPQQPQAGYMYYLSRPAIPKYVSTTAGRVITYDPINSTQLEWGDSQALSIMMKVLSILGVNAREADVSAYAETKSQQDISSPEKL